MDGWMDGWDNCAHRHHNLIDIHYELLATDQAKLEDAIALVDRVGAQRASAVRRRRPTSGCLLGSGSRAR
jgi:hypothetical protein